MCRRTAVEAGRAGRMWWPDQGQHCLQARRNVPPGCVAAPSASLCPLLLPPSVT